MQLSNGSYSIMELLLITWYYPYNYGDGSFLEPELPFLARQFDKIHIFFSAKDCKAYDKLKTPSKVLIVTDYSPLPSSLNGLKRLKPILLSIFMSPFHPFILVFIFFSEIFLLLKKRKFNLQNIKRSFRNIISANTNSTFIKNYIAKNKNIKIIYTFWYDQFAMAALLYKKYFNNSIKCVTRTHGVDLFEQQNPNNYLPFKYWMDKEIDHVFFVSKAGYDYYLSLFAGKVLSKYSVSRLGITSDHEFNDSIENNTNGILKIISCSTMIPRKRVNLIIEALSKIPDIQIKWDHIGDGPERIELEKMAQLFLDIKLNISYQFLGEMDVKSIKNHYSGNYYDVFVSTTLIEGGNPVSMMEAISFGIPVIATNVGGVPEVVNNSTGILIDSDNCIEELVSAIYSFKSKSIEEKNVLRNSCRKYWEDNYMAERQYPLFVNQLMEIANS